MTSRKTTMTIKGQETTPTLEDALDDALDAAAQYEDGTVTICRGGMLCQADPSVDECPWCYVISAEDERDAEVIAFEVMRPVRH